MRIKKSLFHSFGITTLLLGTLPFAHAENFKKFSVSAGWLHVMPQGKANPFKINTLVDKNKQYAVGEISQASFMDAVNLDADIPGEGMTVADLMEMTFKPVTPGSATYAQMLELLVDNDDPESALSAESAGYSQLNGIDQWVNQGTGLEAKDVDTLGLTLNYYINDNVSLQMIGGIPPKVDIKGKGEIVANMSGTATPSELLQSIFPAGIELLQDIPITNLGARKTASTARAWTPALEVQYQFGKSGINKFRPYLGVGLMYAYFNEIKLDKGIEADLVAAGHMIQNIIGDNAGAALQISRDRSENGSYTPSQCGDVSCRMKVDVDTDTAIAPIVTAGFTYDITPQWYGVASVSYAKLSNTATIDVVNETTGQQVIHSTTKIDIDPLITYLGVGYRF